MARAARAARAPPRAAAPAAGRGAARPGPSVLDRGPGLRPRLPRASHGSPAARPRRAARDARRPPRLPPAGPAQATVVVVRHRGAGRRRSEEHTSELQSHSELVCRLRLEKKKTKGSGPRRDELSVIGGTIYSN